jgi:hypothetical protein
LLGATLAAGTGWLVFRLWAVLDLPATGLPGDAPFPGAWRWFFAVWLPALFPAFTALHEVQRSRASDGARAARVIEATSRWDRRSYALLPAFLLLMLGWHGLGSWRMAFGAFFVLVLFAKVGLVLAALYRSSIASAADDTAPSEPVGLCRVLFGAALLLSGFLAAYVVTAVSTAGDEHIYLLNTHSLYADRDVDIRNNVQQRDWRHFYWGRPAPWRLSFLGFPLLLLPGYALGTALLPGYPLAARLGATWTIGLFAASLGVQVYRLGRDLGASRPAAFWAWVVAIMTPPVVVGSGHVYPEVPAAWAVTLAARAALRVGPSRWQPAVGMVAAGAFMVALKPRYLPLAFALGLWTLTRLLTRRFVGWGIVGIGLALAGLYAAGVDALGVATRDRMTFPTLGATLLDWNPHMARALLGLWVDQEFGLLYYAPQWSLAAIGLPLLWQRRREVAIGLLGSLGLYVGVLAKYGWPQWDAGWTPPPRLILAATPLLLPFVAEVFDRCRGRLLATLNTLWLAWSTSVVVALGLVPFWRYNNLDGRTELVQTAGSVLGLDLARFLPSLRAPTTWTWIVLGLGGAVLVMAARRCSRLSATDRSPGWDTGAVLLRPRAAIGLVAGVLLAWIGAASLVPTSIVEAEGMAHSTGIQFGSYQQQDILWVMKRDGEMADRIITWPGVTEIVIVAGGYSTTGVAPRMQLLLDGRPVQSWTLRAGSGDWIQDEYTARVPTSFGRLRLVLRFEELLDQPAASRVQHAYVDRIRFRRSKQTG